MEVLTKPRQCTEALLSEFGISDAVKGSSQPRNCVVAQLRCLLRCLLRRRRERHGLKSVLCDFEQLEALREPASCIFYGQARGTKWAAQVQLPALPEGMQNLRLNLTSGVPGSPLQGGADSLGQLLGLADGLREVSDALAVAHQIGCGLGTIGYSAESNDRKARTL